MLKLKLELKLKYSRIKQMSLNKHLILGWNFEVESDKRTTTYNIAFAL